MDQEITVVIPGEWITLVPQLQHSLIEDAVFTNIYDSLISIGTTGEIIPSLALKWDINDDFTEFTFEIDTSRKFSNGEHASASDFKKAWEEGYRLTPKSNNSSLKDVLYKLEGFENFDKAGEISGIKVVNKNQLILKFQHPFRRALEELSGSRFSASKNDGKNIIGTGRYIIKEVKDKEMKLVPNIYHPDAKQIHPIRLVVDENPDKLELMKSYKNVVCEDLYNIDKESFDKANYNLGILAGQTSKHIAYMLNIAEKSPLVDVRLRRGLQALIFEKFKTFNWPDEKTGTFIFDPQSYLAFQAGVLEKQEVSEIIEQNKKDIEYFQKWNQTNPLRLLMSSKKSLLLDLLQFANVKFFQPFEDITWENYLKKVYNDLDFDIVISNFSVSGGDPDALYHRLGKNGAIKWKASHNPKIETLLEEGRQIYNHSAVHDHYKKVSRAILTEVPYIHLGFTRKITFYNKDEVEVNEQFLKRLDYGFHIYKVK